MFRLIFISLAILFCSAALNAQQTRDPWKNTRQGNTEFRKNDFAKAEKNYREATNTDTAAHVAHYNLGNAMYKQKKWEDAEKAYAASIRGNNADSLSKSWYNLGNTMLQQNKYEESIKAYKQALKRNPNDEDARYNLAYAQSKLKQQQKQNNSSGNNNQQQKKQEQQKQQQQQQQDQNNKQNQNNKQQQEQPQQNQMTPEEAKRMLDAMKDEEQKTRQKLNSRKNPLFSRSKDKDW